MCKSSRNWTTLSKHWAQDPQCLRKEGEQAAPPSAREEGDSGLMEVGGRWKRWPSFLVLCRLEEGFGELSPGRTQTISLEGPSRPSTWTPGPQGSRGWKEPMAREGNPWTKDTQRSGVDLGAGQTQSSWMPGIETKSRQRTLAWSPHFLQETVGWQREGSEAKEKLEGKEGQNRPEKERVRT